MYEMQVPRQPKIYHIVHINNLNSILNSKGLFSYSQVKTNNSINTNIGMSKIKERRLTELRLSSHPDLFVGQCVPFYFCPRSVMLYVIYRGDSPEIEYHDGQEGIIHLQSDLHSTVQWASQTNKRWAFTLSNAGSYYFEDTNNLNNLGLLDWNAINATNWQHCKEEKQAEFLIENSFPWHLVEGIGVYSQKTYNETIRILNLNSEITPVRIIKEWYY